jgi:hypothetical protein
VTEVRTSKITSHKGTQIPQNKVLPSDTGRRKRLRTLLLLLRTPVVFWLLVWLALYFFLRVYGMYHFLYLDQQNMFLYDRSFFLSFVYKPAGLVEYFNALMTQYFILPYCGILIVSTLLTLTGMLTAAVIKRIAPQSNLFVCSLLPVVTQLFPVFDVNYSYSGILAGCMMLAALYYFFGIRSIAGRIAYTLIVSVILFWVAGAVAFLFVVCVFLSELLNRFTRAYVFLLPLLLVAGLAIWSVMCSWAADYRFLLLPDGYFTRRLHPGVAVYLSWICLPVLLLLVFLLRHRNKIRPGRKSMERFVQLAFVVGIFVFGMKHYIDLKTVFFKEMDYYARTEQWDRIIARCRGSMSNYLYKCYLNLALAEKGELGNHMFAFDQSGLKGLILPKNWVSHVSVILSDIYFSMGHIALSQQMAFEANMSTPGAGNPRMYRRLIQTNLIMGVYPVAEKYIALLEKTRYYSSWAAAQRRFLWNDSAVDADPVLGIKRKCIPAENMLSELYGLDFDLKQIAQQNPAHRVTIQYVGVMYLLDKNMAAFNDLIETFDGTDVLSVLPESFQEALIILSEQHPDYWTRFKISETTKQRYAGFRQQILANRNNASALPSLMFRSFGNTYWYYFMFKRILVQDNPATQELRTKILKKVATNNCCIKNIKIL